MQALERAFENNVLLRSCDEEQRGHIFDAMSEQTFTKGTVIIRQGDSGNFFYVIGEFCSGSILEIYSRGTLKWFLFDRHF